MSEYFSSAFEPFGFLEFSGQDPLAKRIYDTLRESLGSAFVGASQDAETFADAMCLAAAELQIECAAAQDDPSQVNYLIGEIERDYRIVQSRNSTLEERRAELLAAQLAALGSRFQVIQDGLFAIFGDQLFGWRFMNLDPEDPNSEVKLATNMPQFVPPTVNIKVIKLTEPVMPGEQTVPYEWVCAFPGGIANRDKFYIEPVSFSAQELVEVTETKQIDGEPHITATFTKPHQSGTFATTAPQPFWASTRCHCVIVVSDAALGNSNLCAKAHAFLRKTLPATSTWAICQSAGLPYWASFGPFTVGVGRIGQTPISPDTITI